MPLFKVTLYDLQRVSFHAFAKKNTLLWLEALKYQAEITLPTNSYSTN